MRAKLLFFFISIILSCTANCQKIIISGEETSRSLRWSDFKDTVDESTPYSAYTSWNLRTGSDGVQFAGDSAIIKNFAITLKLDSDKSWVKENKQTDYLLMHEQGHFNLGILCMNEILLIVSETSFHRNDYKLVLQNIFDSTLKKYNGLGLQYDEETVHGTNKDQQQKWNDFFAEHLNKSPK